MLCKNQIHLATVEDLNDLGYGVCRIESIVVFVPACAPGDVVRVKIIKLCKNYAIGKLEEIVTPSACRTEPECASFLRCGGCSFLHVDDKCERSLKESFVRAAVKKAGMDIPVLPLVQDSTRLHYRNKAQYPLFCDAEGQIRAGFFARHSHRPIPAEDCLLQPESFGMITRTACRLFTQEHLTCYNEEEHRGLLRHLNLREGSDGNVVVEVVLNAKEDRKLRQFLPKLAEECPCVCGICLNYNPQKTNVIRGAHTETIYGDATLTQALCDKTFLHGPASFFQVNRPAASLLFETARNLLDAKEDESVCDLYCGVGAVGQCVAPQSRLHGADVVSEAISYARKNAERNGCSASYVAMDAADYFEAAGTFDAVLLDPPRSGLSDKMRALLLEKLPKKILYISCNPQTLCRDLAALTENCYQTNAITPVDLFPKTGHVECVTLLTRVI